MRFQIEVKNKQTGKNKVVEATWTEDYDYPEIETQEQAEQWGRETIDSYNAYLRPHEVAREFVSAEILGPSEIEEEIEEKRHGGNTWLEDDDGDEET